MKNRDITLIIIVLLGIGWLIFDNYHRSSATTPTKPATVKETPVTPIVPAKPTTG